MQKREAVEYLRAAYRIGVRRGCLLMMQSRTVYNYRSCRNDRALTQRIREIAETRLRDGVQRIHILLRREGWEIGRDACERLMNSMLESTTSRRIAITIGNHSTNSIVALPPSCLKNAFVLAHLPPARFPIVHHS